MGTLSAALDWAARGFNVFPIAQNSKVPAFGASWLGTATTDEATIRAWWTDPVVKSERDYNIGVDCTGLVVLDIDVKDGKQGVAEYEALGGHYGTLVVATPSGGYHCYFHGPDSTNSGLASSVDVRSHNGYVLAPGSYVNDGKVEGFYQVVTDAPVADVPPAIAGKLTPTHRRSELAHESNDTAANVQAAINFLGSAPVAVEGAGGDNTTFMVAARLVRELSLSPDTALELMLAHWNEKCTPPWQPDELALKVQNATEYGNADQGRVDASKVFAGIEVAPPPSPFTQAEALTWGNAIPPHMVPSRPWMIDRVLMARETTLLLAPGSVGKSSMALAIAAHLAVGKNFGPNVTHTKCKSAVYNGEDDLAEQSRRLFAVCEAYNLDFNEVGKNILLMDSDMIDLKVCVAQGRIATSNSAIVDHLVEMLSPQDIGLLVLDPMVDVHEADETDNPQMNRVMATLKYIAHQANVALVLNHHTSKGGTKQEDRVGNADIARGASGIVNKSRISFTMLNASATDAEEYGMQDGERLRYVRVDDAKMNLALSSGTPMWFEKMGVHMPTGGDTVGALKHVVLHKDKSTLKLRIAKILISAMHAGETASLNVTQAATIVIEQEPIWANKSDTEVKKKLAGMFTAPLDVEGATIRIVKENGAAPKFVVS